MGKQKTKRDEALYNTIQENEIPFFFEFLPSAVEAVIDRVDLWHGMGRKPLPLIDVIICLVVKEYFKLSLRRSIGFLKLMKKAGFINVQIPCFKSLGNYQNNGEIQFYVKRLVELTSNVFSTIEKEMATDSTGISTKCFSSWFSIRVCKKSRRRDHIMVHISVGTKSNIVVALNVQNGKGKDNVIFRSHVRNVSPRFHVEDWSGDSMYLSRDNCNSVDEIGAIPWFKPKSNTTSKAKGSSAWKRMVNGFKENPEVAYEKYHMRSNVESTNSAKKRKFSSFVRSRNSTSQRIEESLSWVGYNLSLMPRAVHEFGLDPISTFKMR
mgnify:CR=1 FL=1